MHYQACTFAGNSKDLTDDIKTKQKRPFVTNEILIISTKTLHSKDELTFVNRLGCSTGGPRNLI